MAEIRTYATPSQLYRYRRLDPASIEDELRAIRDGYVFCPTIAELNDPMEGSHRESTMLRRSPNLERTLAEVSAAKHRLGVASFSETHRHEPMWAYYAGNFSGMCISYSLKRLLRVLPDDHQFVRILYGEKPPKLVRGRASADERARLVLSAKTLKWASEREWRLIRPERGAAPYAPEPCVRKVYLGSRVHPALLERVTSEMALLDIPVAVMRVDRYSLTFDDGADGSASED